MESNGSSLVFRPMEAADIPQVLQIENSSFSVPWSQKAFADEMENDLAHYLVAEYGGAVAAYAGVWVIFDEAHITNVAVLPAYRRLSIGEKLMRRMIAWVREMGASSMTLEVRPSNTAALKLYEKLHFARAGRRKGYYTEPAEDALILWLSDLTREA